MADPVTLGTMALTATAGIISGIGQADSANSQAAAFRYKSGVALLNKQINEQNANWATQAGDIQAQESGMKSRQEIGETKVVQAASGFDVNSGTNEKIREDQTTVAAFNQNVIRWDAAKTSFGYETKSVMDTAESNLDQLSATNVQKAGQIEMVGSFINTAGSVGSKWMQAKSIGMV